MQSRRRRTVRLLHGTSLAFGLAAFVLFGRTTMLLLFVWGLLILIRPAWMKPANLIAFWIAFCAAAIAPVDISFLNRPGPPRFVPYRMGLYMPRKSPDGRREDVVLGGCMATGLEPAWVWVW